MNGVELGPLSPILTIIGERIWVGVHAGFSLLLAGRQNRREGKYVSEKGRI